MLQLTACFIITYFNVVKYIFTELVDLGLLPKEDEGTDLTEDSVEAIEEG